MKTKGKHPHRSLTDRKVQQTKTPGRHADGNGLYLIVDRTGAKRWVLRTVVNSRRRDMGLGSVELVSLKNAREQAAKYRHIARAMGATLLRSEEEIKSLSQLSQKPRMLCILREIGKIKSTRNNG